MGNRLTKIYTRTGDNGTTGLADGSRVGKDNPRIEAFGTIDELMSTMGLVISTLPEGDEIAGMLQGIQHRLFDLGGELAIPGTDIILESDTEELEAIIDRFNAELPPLKNFILPGGSQSAAFCHMARSLCRRAERDLVRLCIQQPTNDASQQYLNRLSDLLFVVARILARRDGGQEILWQPRPQNPTSE